MVQHPGVTADFVRRHVGEEMQYLAFAAQEFRRPEAARFQVALHDSALARARTLLDFLTGSGEPSAAYVTDCYADPASRPAAPAGTRAWLKFITSCQSHVGFNREDAEDAWPDRGSGEPSGDDRLVRLARFVVTLIRERSAYARDECRVVLDLIAQRANEYLDDPTEERFHAMDPLSLIPTRAF